MSGTMREVSHGTNGTSETPICDLIEVLMSRDLSRGQLETALKAARAIEVTLQAKPAQSIGFLLEKREKDRLRKAAYRSKKSQNVPRDNYGTKDESVLKTKTVDIVKESKTDRQTDSPNVPRDNTGQIAGQKPGHQSDWPADYREQFWATYPRKTEKKAALAKLDAIHKSGKVAWAIFFAGVKRYAGHVAGTEERYIKHPTTWLNRGCWDDEFNNKNGGGLFDAANRPSTSRDGFAVINARLRRGIAERAAGEAAAGAASAGYESGHGFPDASPTVVGVAGVRQAAPAPASVERFRAQIARGPSQ